MGAVKIGRSHFLSYSFYLLVVQADFYLNIHFYHFVSDSVRSVSLEPAVRRKQAVLEGVAKDGLSRKVHYRLF